MVTTLKIKMMQKDDVRRWRVQYKKRERIGVRLDKGKEFLKS